jgi:GGDEF domain-containing protein
MKTTGENVTSVLQALCYEGPVDPASVNIGALLAVEMEDLRTSIAALPAPKRAVVTENLLSLIRSTQQAANAAMKASLTDTVTGGNNRAAMIQLLTEKVQAIREGATHTIVVGFADLDGFKDLNDNAGHEAGDKALRQVNERLKGLLNFSNDIIGTGRKQPHDRLANLLPADVGRYGGDEIIILLTYDGDNKFHEGKIRNKITAALHGLWYFGKNGELCPIGASVGFAVIDRESIDLTQSNEQIVSGLVKKADLAMYRDKWGPEGKIGNGLESQNPDAPKFKRLEEERAVYEGSLLTKTRDINEADFDRLLVTA